MHLVNELVFLCLSENQMSSVAKLTASIMPYFLKDSERTKFNLYDSEQYIILLICIAILYISGHLESVMEIINVMHHHTTSLSKSNEGFKHS